MKDIRKRKLTAEEERIIAFKGTEPAFRGQYDQHFAAGTYHCKRCGEALYQSAHKFDAGCGWPAFEKELPGAVRRRPDPDGQRTEISCSHCGGHLGHIFLGEGLTATNVRHCVNSLSLDFVPREKELGKDKAYFAGGCFWGVEHLFRQQPGVLETTVGYMGGQKDKPTYPEVNTGQTGHRETVEVVFDPERTNFLELARFFFEIHDPTQINRQGPDVGEPYGSAIFYLNKAQKQAAEKLIAALSGKGYKVATELKKAGNFWPAEEDHQDYYQKTGQTPYCHFYTKRF